MKKTKISPLDFKFVPKDPDPNFSPAKNRKVIREVIKATEATRRKKGREHNDAYQERAEAVTSYLKSLDTGRSNSDILKYFGRREMARLKGKEVLEKLNDQLTVYGRLGNVLRKPS